MKHTFYEWNRLQMENYLALFGKRHKKNGLHCQICGFELSDSFGREEPDDIHPQRIPVHCENCGFTGLRMAQYVGKQ